MNITKLVITLIAMLLLQACTVANYQVINKVSEAPPRKVNEPCDIKYWLSFTSSSYFRTNTQGVRHLRTDENVARNLKKKYIESTKEVLNTKGCTAAYIESAENANLRIQVERTVDLGDRGDALIEGLTLGLIPIWGTREGQFTFTFYNTKAKTTHSYIVDENYYIHLFLMPVFWAFTLDEFKPYKESLTDFIDNCTTECQPKNKYKIEPPPGKASIILMTPSTGNFGAFRHLSIKINGLPVAELSTENFTILYVDPGKAVIESQKSTLGWPLTEKTVDVSANETVFAIWTQHITTTPNFDASWQWDVIPRGSAEGYLFRYTYVPPNKIP